MNMINRYILLILAALAFWSCAGYDDPSIWDELKEHEDRISALEEQCRDINKNVSSISAILGALQDNDYVTGTTALTEGGAVIGYIIHFSKSGSVTIYHGKDGEDGESPDVGIKKAADDRYYWTYDDEWMTDEDGEMIPATVTDPDGGYIVPQFMVADGIWYISYDKGNTWREIGNSADLNGNGSFFKDVDVSSQDYIILTLQDGQQIRIPTWKSFQELEALVNGINSSLASLQAVIEAMQNNDHVTGIVPIIEDGKEVGYTIYFAKRDSIDIYHGRDGEDGTTPSIGVLQDTDGVYYWTLDGEWLFDGSGNRIPCTGRSGQDGEDGIVPSLKVEDGYWYVSYDGGNTWEPEPLGPSSERLEEYLFAEIGYDAEFLYITLADGQTLSLLRHDNAFSSIVKQYGLSISDNVVTVSGQLCLDASEFAYCQVSLYYSDSSVFNIYDANCISTTSFDADGGFSFSFSGLESGDEYHCCVCVKFKSSKFYSPVEEIVVAHPYSEQKDLDAASAIDLSDSGTANCYIVTESGLYKFKSVKGNTSEKLGAIASAEILWESFGTSVAPEFFDLVDGVCYKDGYVIVKTADEFKEGNAVVAVKDDSGKVLWSWHIWMTDMPAGQVYYNDAGTVMDRSLGAVSTTPGDVGALGLLYQWGRKDPFLGSSSIKSSTRAKSTITWPGAVKSDSVTGTMEFSVANPTTYITLNDLNYDWFYTDATVSDTTRWAVSAALKSVNDPCPHGWRIPEGGSTGVWGTALGVKTYASGTYDSTNKGVQMGGILGDDENIWYPSAGNIDHYSGSLTRAGSVGMYWTANPYKNSYQGMVSYVTTGGAFYVYYGDFRSRASSVRCIKE